MNKIIISGAQSTGKSTIIEELKKNDRVSGKYTFEREIVRSIKAKGYSINENGDDNTQLMILSRMMNIYASPHPFISDRGFLDCLAYTLYSYYNGKVSDDILKIAKTLLDTMRYDIIFYIPPEFDIKSDGIRSDDIIFRDKIVDIFENIIRLHNLDVVNLTGTVENRVNTVLNVLGFNE